MAQAKGSLLGRVYFDSTKSKLTRGSRTTLMRMVNDLQAMGLRTVGVNGYTDTLGSQRYNERLSRERAGKVRTFLERNIKGLIPERRPFGERQPIKSESKKPGRWQSRRVKIRVV
jgi:outer membrane protein OmpA-like peptidoglycan-associated protein